MIDLAEYEIDYGFELDEDDVEILVIWIGNPNGKLRIGTEHNIFYREPLNSPPVSIHCYPLTVVVKNDGDGTDKHPLFFRTNMARPGTKPAEISCIIKNGATEIIMNKRKRRTSTTVSNGGGGN